MNRGVMIYWCVFRNGVTVRKNVLPDTQQAKFHYNKIVSPSER